MMLLTALAASLSLTVLPRFGLAPCDIRVTARVERSDANREACLLLVDAEGVTTYQSCRQLDGADAPVFRQELIERVSPGQYAIVLAVRTANGKWLVTSVTACYAGGEVSCVNP